MNGAVAKTSKTVRWLVGEPKKPDGAYFCLSFSKDEREEFIFDLDKIVAVSQGLAKEDDCIKHLINFYQNTTPLKIGKVDLLAVHVHDYLAENSQDFPEAWKGYDWVLFADDVFSMHGGDKVIRCFHKGISKVLNLDARIPKNSAIAAIRR